MPEPFTLDPFFRPLSTLPGLGPRLSKLAEKLVGGPKVLDLLWHKPIDYVDRRFSPTINEAPEGTIATMAVTITKHMPNARRQQPYRISATDGTGTITTHLLQPAQKLAFGATARRDAKESSAARWITTKATRRW